jgi:hypothetical protein
MAVQHVRIAPTSEPEAVNPSRVPPPLLPPWESFPAGDRQRLVRTILQVAQRQVTTTRQRREPGR